MDTTRIEKLRPRDPAPGTRGSQKEEQADTPTLFSMFQEEIPNIEDASNEIPEPIEIHTEIAPEAKPRTRTWSKNPVRMRDEAVVSANKVGRAQGYCQRSDIERTLRRMNPESSREDVRSDVNDAVAELGLTCIIFNSYRYYRRSDRGRILEISTTLFDKSRVFIIAIDGLQGEYAAREESLSEVKKENQKPINPNYEPLAAK